MKKGRTGIIIDIFKNNILYNLDMPALFKKYNTFYNDDHLLPDFLFPLIQIQFEAVRIREVDFLAEHLQAGLVPDSTYSAFS